MSTARFALIGSTGALFFAALTAQAFAGPERYCDAFARDFADRKAYNSGADVLASAAFGALTGAMIGGAINNSKGAGAGAIIGGVSGTALSAGAASNKWRRAYNNAFEDCVNRYEQEQPAVYEQSAPPPPPAASKANTGPQPGTQAWNNYCEFEVSLLQFENRHV